MSYLPLFRVFAADGGVISAFLLRDRFAYKCGPFVVGWFLKGGGGRNGYRKTRQETTVVG